VFLDPIHFIKEKAFTQSFCENIISQSKKQKTTKADIKDGNNNNRKSNISWLQDESLIKQITPIVNEANKKCNWNFLLREFEPLQYTIYNKDDYYDWHIDSHKKQYQNGLIRKLSFTLFLNDDYDGGDFRICQTHPNPDKVTLDIFKPKIGTIIIFPSHTWHKVNKIKKGIRKTLVGWIVGKPFV